MRIHFWITFLAAINVCSAGILFPNDLPSVLEMFYSLIPPIRAGIDHTKLGYGFRIGKNADVQFVLELGPQLDLASSKREIARKRKFPTNKYLVKTTESPSAAKLTPTRGSRTVKKDQTSSSNENLTTPNVESNEIR